MIGWILVGFAICTAVGLFGLSLAAISARDEEDQRGRPVWPCDLRAASQNVVESETQGDPNP